MRTTDSKDCEENHRVENEEFIEIKKFDMPKIKRI
tara:strand:+ start:272 stop:376 length:105 start_codon:yes stop_codon:yes gene_type:complete